MIRKAFFGLGLASFIGASVFAGPVHCDSGGGPTTLCVRFDNLGFAPVEDFDFEFTFPSGQAPNIELKRGDDGSTMYEWRVWSKDSQDEPADIGSITAPGGHNYSVKILNPSDGSGAASVQSIILDPSGDHYSNIAAAQITGDITDALTVVSNSSNDGGLVNLTMLGELEGDLAASTLGNVEIGPISGSLFASRLSGYINIDGGVSGLVNIGTMNQGSAIYLVSLSGTLTFGVANNATANVYVWAGIATSGSVNVFGLGGVSNSLVLFGTLSGSGVPVYGTVNLWDGIPSGATVRFQSDLDIPGTINLNNNGIAQGGSLLLYGGGSGDIINGGSIAGAIDLGQTIGTPTYFTGTASFTDAASTADIFVNDLDVDDDNVGDSVIEFTGSFGGNICGFIDGAAWPTSPLRVPANIHLSAIGTGGTICSTAVCGSSLFSADGINKSRFVSFTPSSSETRERAVGIRLVSLHAVDPPYTAAPTVPFDAFEGKLVYVGAPTTYVESAVSQTPFKAATTQCEPYYQDWSSVGLLHVTGSAIVPSSEYAVEMMVGRNASCASNLSVVTTRWGDVETPFAPPSTSTQPDLADVSAMVNKFRGAIGAPIKARALIAPNNPFGEISTTILSVDFGFQHISLCVDAFRGARYPAQMGKCATAEQPCTMDDDCTGGTGPCELYCP